ncbi:hypothetical protein MHBO_001206 [Bonamia ostreae]|uniref:Uncharacterized protein n=1 Tax=Bonamia ostreae TaxID=126728 RepID=A0ABV2AI63_9EUKA
MIFSSQKFYEISKMSKNRINIQTISASRHDHKQQQTIYPSRCRRRREKNQIHSAVQRFEIFLFCQMSENDLFFVPFREKQSANWKFFRICSEATRDDSFVYYSQSAAEEEQDRRSGGCFELKNKI